MLITSTGPDQRQRVVRELASTSDAGIRWASAEMMVARRAHELPRRPEFAGNSFGSFFPMPSHRNSAVGFFAGDPTETDIRCGSGAGADGEFPGLRRTETGRARQEQVFLHVRGPQHAAERRFLQYSAH
jgi:hypothetical protein